jgi:hypothetical protein
VLLPKGLRPVRPMVLNPRPGVVLTLLGGWVGTILLNASMFAAPVFGLPFIDIPHLLGGIFFDSPPVAFWVGFWLNFITGMIVWPSMLAVAWPLLPGWDIGVLGSAIKGLALSIGLWVLSGMLLPIAEWLNRLDPALVHPPGFFGLNLGLAGAGALLLGHLLYGLSVALVAGMGEGIFVLETVGWPGHRRAETPPSGELYPDAKLPEYPAIGER